MTAYKLLTPDDYRTTRWSGGTTTELAISPRDAVYADRNFLWRVSSALVEDETSDFTPLPDYNRLIVERACTQIRENGGNFFMMFENTVLFAVRMFCHKDSRDFRNHLFQGIVLDGLMWKAGDFSLEAQPVLHELVHLIDMDGLRVEDTQELLGLIHLCVAAASPALSYILLSDGDELLAREMLLPKIELLRKGDEK